MKHYFLSLILTFLFFSCKSESINIPVIVHPISHGSLILEYGDVLIYVDPIGNNEDFSAFKKPTLVLITDIHGDHLNIETLEALTDSTQTLIIPKAVDGRLNANIKGNRVIMNNGDTNSIGDIVIEAIPMYNLREEALKFHEKGRGNGYIITLGKERIYISGDTEDIPEMRALQNIDKAFVCMNLPWTMTIESAADAVLEFKPKTIYPYHYRGTSGLSDVEKFKSLVISKNKDINVTLLNWYSE